MLDNKTLHEGNILWTKNTQGFEADFVKNENIENGVCIILNGRKNLQRMNNFV